MNTSSGDNAWGVMLEELGLKRTKPKNHGAVSFYQHRAAYALFLQYRKALLRCVKKQKRKEKEETGRQIEDQESFSPHDLTSISAGCSLARLSTTPEKHLV